MATYSPDILALNPELAAATKRAKTPGGKGRGWAPDEQSYRRAGLGAKYDPALLTASAAQNALVLIRGHAKRGGWLGEAEVRRALDALDELVMWAKGRAT